MRKNRGASSPLSCGTGARSIGCEPLTQPLSHSPCPAAFLCGTVGSGEITLMLYRLLTFLTLRLGQILWLWYIFFRLVRFLVEICKDIIEQEHATHHPHGRDPSEKFLPGLSIRNDYAFPWVTEHWFKFSYWWLISLISTLLKNNMYVESIVHGILKVAILFAFYVPAVACLFLSH